MKARSLQALGLGLAIVALAGTTSQALAQPGQRVKPDGFRSRILLEGSHGFLIVVSSVGHEQVELTAFGDEGTATYRAPGRASRKGIEADFGDFGQIAMRFHGTPRPLNREKESGCRGKRTIGAAGTFRGHIEFEGEGGFAGVRARKARGFFVRSFRRVCNVREVRKRPDRTASRKPRPSQISIRDNTLIAESREMGRGTRFAAVELEFDNGRRAALLTVVSASSVERVGAVRISRDSFATSNDRMLFVSARDKEPTVAKVAPTWPFKGTATYSREAGAPPGWDGNLAVLLPGIGSAPLTGKGFRVTLCRNKGDFARCQERLTKRTLRVVGRWLSQGSGSHSQPFAEARLSWSR